MHQTQGVITLNKQLSTDIYRMTIKAPEIAAQARPGQFIMVKANGLDPLLRRPFSIHQVLGDEIAILFKQIGKGTALLGKMSEAAQVDLLGPLGNGFQWRGDDSICLVGGGMGVAPLLFLAQEMIKDKIKPQIMLGARNKAEMMAILPYFEPLGCTISCATDDGSMGHKGFVIDCMRQELAADTSCHIYTCGPHPMMRGIAQLCNANNWPCQVSMETMMACGISACLGCTIEASEPNQKGGNYLHVCQDGPVFQAEKIRWEK